MSEHVKKEEAPGLWVCSGCVNALGLKVSWDQAERVGHAIPNYDDTDWEIQDAFQSAPDMMGGLRAVYELGRSGATDAAE